MKSDSINNMPKAPTKKANNSIAAVNPYSSAFTMRLSNSPIRMGRAGNHNNVYVSILKYILQ